MAITYLISVYSTSSPTRTRARVFLLAYVAAGAGIFQRLPAWKLWIDQMQQMTGLALQASRVRCLLSHEASQRHS